jgi:tripartite-type tricarboxylate transporter receptor subunit TctC
MVELQAAVKPILSTCALLLLIGWAPVRAIEFPSAPVHLVVPSRAGGSTDVLARVVSLRLAEVWGQPVIVKNLPGHPSVSGTQVVANAQPDGRMLLVVNATLAMNEALYRRLPYDALRSFTPIGLLARQHLVLLVHPSSSVRTVTDLIESSRRGRARLSYATSGSGSLAHLAGELLKLMTAASFAHLPSRSTDHALEALVTQHVSCAIVALPRALPYLQSGRLRAIAVAGSGRSTAVPDVPTVGGSVAGYSLSTWIGLLAPYGMSVPLVRKLSSDTQAVMGRPDLAELLGGLGYEPRPGTPNDLQNRIRADIERYSRIVLDAGIRVQ